VILSALVGTANANNPGKIRIQAANGAEGSMAFDGTSMVFDNVQDVLVGGVALAKSGEGVSATDFASLQGQVAGLAKQTAGFSTRLSGLEAAALELKH
jgi:hypothetical protein